MKVLGIDIGGSAVKGAPVDTESGRLLEERYRVETPEALTPLEMARAINEIVQHFRWRGKVGVGYPGVIQGTKTCTAANLHPRFVGLDAAELFSRETQRPIALVNDADAAGIAEMTFGAGRGVRGTVLLLTLGTGVGSALFHDGSLVPNTELGHLPIRGKSAECFVSASARKKRDLSWSEWGRELGGYIGILEGLFWPDLIIIGGGVSAKSDKYFRFVKSRAKMVPATFQNGAGIVGAALWAVRQGVAARVRTGPAKASAKTPVAR